MNPAHWQRDVGLKKSRQPTPCGEPSNSHIAEKVVLGEK